MNWVKNFFKISFFICHFTIISQNVYNINGTWQGMMISENDTFAVVMDVYPDSMSKILISLPYIASVDNKVQRLRYQNDSLSFNINNLAANIKLIYVNDSLKGYWHNTNTKDFTELVLIRNDNPIRVNRPQTPNPPFPYHEQILRINNKKAGVTIEGTLTIPAGNGTFPAVILVTGSGPQNRNSEIFLHNSFWVIADYLTRKGIAVFRFDERGVGKSTGTYSKSTTLDFAEDVIVIHKELSKHPSLNRKKIGVLGHSEGGVVAAIVASKLKSCAFIVSMAGSAVNGREILLEQTRQMHILNNKSDEFIQFDLAFRNQIFDIFQNTNNNAELATQIRKLFEKTILEISPEQAKEHHISPNIAEIWILQLSSPWMKTFINLNPDNYLKKIKCPALIMIGEKDFQVPYSQNMPIFAKAFTEGKNENVTMLKMESLNHLFQTANKGSLNEYARIEETLSPKFLNILTEWIIKTTKTK